MSGQEDVVYSNCFACGQDNPIGLRLVFHRGDDGNWECRFRPEEDHQGYPGVVHGGIVSTLLDEVMAKQLVNRDVPAVTAELRVRFKEPARVGRTLLCRAQVVRERGRFCKLEAELIDEDSGVAVATAEGKFVSQRP